ncbi:MAG: leucine-rich repeat protein [Firmicutes bacterium]|nr:leucine-rich repeat protein [Bacillota bacterium]
MFKKGTITNKKAFAIFVALFVMLAVIGAFFVTNDTETKLTYADSTEIVEAVYYELSPILDKHLYENGEQLEISFTLDSQYVLSNITFEVYGFEVIAAPVLNGGNSTIGVVLEHSTGYLLGLDIFDTEARFTLYAEVVGGNVFDSSIYGYATINGIYIGQYQAEQQDAITASEEALLNTPNSSASSTNSFSATVYVGGKIRWQDAGGTYQNLQRTKVEFVYASDLGNGTYMPWGVTYFTYTNNSGDYSFSLTNPLNLDVSLRVYAQGRNVDWTSGDAITNNSFTIYQNGGLERHWHGVSYMSSPNGTYTRNLDMQNDIDTTRGFEIGQAVLWAANYCREMHGIDAPHVAVNYPSNIANNNSPGYFDFGVTSRIFMPSGNINWSVVMHEYGHHIGWHWGFDLHPAQNLEIIMGVPPTVPYDYHWEDSMFDAPKGARYSKSQNIRISWAEAWAEFFSKMVRHYYLLPLDAITATGTDIRSFDISEGGVGNALLLNGEASIRTIEAVLWRIYRDVFNAGRLIGNISNPNHSQYQDIRYSHKLLWDVIRTSQVSAPTTERNFSTFANYFINEYPEYRSGFGQISAIHGISPNTFASSSYTASSPPTFTWQRGYPSARFPVNRFDLVFYDRLGAEIFRRNLGNPSTLSYALPLLDWQQIYNNNTGFVSAHIFAYQTNDPITGGFISEGIRFQLPMSINYRDARTNDFWWFIKPTLPFSGEHGANHPTIHTYGTNTTLVNPTKAGHAFGGWYSLGNGSGSPITVLSATGHTNNITLYAKWTPVPTYGVIFNTYGGSSVPSQTVYAGQKASRPSADPTRAGYLFDDWYTSSSYITKFDFNNNVINSNTIIHAKWMPSLQYTLITSGANANTYSVSGGTLTTAQSISISTHHPVDGKAITEIAENGFKNFTSLQSIIIPNSVTSIGFGAFFGCNSLTTITIPFVGATLNGNTNKHFGYIFGDQYPSEQNNLVPQALKAVTITGGNAIATNAFAFCQSIQTINLPSALTAIGAGAFAFCVNLTDINIPHGVSAIESGAFAHCNSLTSIVLPSTIVSIGEYAFNSCFLLSSINIPNSTTHISNNAFQNCASLTSITIPSSVTSIGFGAFEGCSSLASITIPFVGATLNGGINTDFGFIFGSVATYAQNDFVPASLKTVTITGGSQIHEFAFWRCANIQTINLPSTLISIAAHAFISCEGLTSINIPYGITTINYATFSYCYSLESIVLPSSLTSIAAQAFAQSGLSSIIIPNSVTFIGNGAFADCKDLASINIPYGVTAIGSSTFVGSGLQSIELHGNITHIGDYAFYACENLTDVVLHDGITHIGEQAFYACRNLTSIVLPDTISSIGEYAFTSCIRLVSINIPLGVTGLSNYLFNWAYGMPSFVIPNHVTSIGTGAFANCFGLQSVAIPATVLSVGADAFANCHQLEIFLEFSAVPSSWHSNWNPSNRPVFFYSAQSQANHWRYVNGVPALWEVTVGLQYSLNSNGYSSWWLVLGMGTATDSHLRIPAIHLGLPVIGIEGYAFQNQTNITRVTLPEGLVFLNGGAFSNCKNLTSVFIPSTMAAVSYHVFEGCSALESIVISADNATYKSEGNCVIRKYDNALVAGCKTSVIPNYVTKIADGAFYNCDGLTNISIPNSVSEIGYSAFSGSGIISIIVPDSVVSIKDGAFSFCPNLIYAKLPQNLTILSGGLFALSESLISVDLPTNLTSIEVQAFLSCLSLQSIDMPNSVISIGAYAFLACDSLSSINIPLGITQIEERTFSYTGLTSIIIPSNITSIGNGAFFGSRSLISVTLPDVITFIGEYAFANCPNLTSINIPTSMTYIPEGLFSWSYGVTSILLSSVVVEVGELVTQYCSNLSVYTELSIPPLGWHANWNSSNRPILWGCTLSPDKTYVVSFKKTATSIQNPNGFIVSAPRRIGYNFAGWSTTLGGSPAYQAWQVQNAPNGTILYAVWG